jgi:hypothetical protein
MSLVAASLTKSAVAGLISSAELIPVFSPTYWASTGALARTAAAATEIANFLM